MRRNGYALFVALASMVLLLILATAFSMVVRTETHHTLQIASEEEALNGADSGIQYALESVREGQTLPDSFDAAAWNLLQTQNGKNVCFKIFQNDAGCAAGDVCVVSYGEVVNGACGDYAGQLELVSAVRVVQGVITAQTGTLAVWQEVLP